MKVASDLMKEIEFQPVVLEENEFQYENQSNIWKISCFRANQISDEIIEAHIWQLNFHLQAKNCQLKGLWKNFAGNNSSRFPCRVSVSGFGPVTFGLFL